MLVGKESMECMCLNTLLLLSSSSKSKSFASYLSFSCFKEDFQVCTAYRLLIDVNMLLIKSEDQTLSSFCKDWFSDDWITLQHSNFRQFIEDKNCGGSPLWLPQETVPLQNKANRFVCIYLQFMSPLVQSTEWDNTHVFKNVFKTRKGRCKIKSHDDLISGTSFEALHLATGSLTTPLYPYFYLGLISQGTSYILREKLLRMTFCKSWKHLVVKLNHKKKILQSQLG